MCMHVCEHVCMCMYVCMYACMYVSGYVRMCVCMHACLSACMYVCTCVWHCVHVCMYACMFVRTLYVSVYVWYVHARFLARVRFELTCSLYEHDTIVWCRGRVLMDPISHAPLSPATGRVFMGMWAPKVSVDFGCRQRRWFAERPHVFGPVLCPRALSYALWPCPPVSYVPVPVL